MSVQMSCQQRCVRLMVQLKLQRNSPKRSPSLFIHRSALDGHHGNVNFSYAYICKTPRAGNALNKAGHL